MPGVMIRFHFFKWVPFVFFLGDEFVNIFKRTKNVQNPFFSLNHLWKFHPKKDLRKAFWRATNWPLKVPTMSSDKLLSCFEKVFGSILSWKKMLNFGWILTWCGFFPYLLTSLRKKQLHGTHSKRNFHRFCKGPTKSIRTYYVYNV